MATRIVLYQRTATTRQRRRFQRTLLEKEKINKIKRKDVNKKVTDESKTMANSTGFCGQTRCKPQRRWSELIA